MEISLKQAAELTGGKIYGDEQQKINGVARINEAGLGDLTFLYLPAYEKFFHDTQAAAIFVKPDFERTRADINYIVVDEPHQAVQEIVVAFFSYEIQLKGIAESAKIAETAKIGESCAIGENVVIGENCTVGNGTKILHNTVILENTSIGDNCLLYQNVSVRENCVIGDRVIVHAGTVIGSDGFGFTKNSEGVYSKIPQIGNVIIGDDVELGANVTVDRAAIGSTIIEKGVKLDNLVQVAHNVTIGENTVMSAQSGVAGSTNIGKRNMFGGQVGVAGHINTTDDVVIGAQTGVSKSLSKPGMYFGYPAKEMRTALRLESHFRNLPNYADKIKDLEKRIKDLEEVIQNQEEENS